MFHGLSGLRSVHYRGWCANVAHLHFVGCRFNLPYTPQIVILFINVEAGDPIMVCNFISKLSEDTIFGSQILLVRESRTFHHFNVNSTLTQPFVGRYIDLKINLIIMQCIKF